MFNKDPKRNKKVLKCNFCLLTSTETSSETVVVDFGEVVLIDGLIRHVQADALAIVGPLALERSARGRRVVQVKGSCNRKRDPNYEAKTNFMELTFSRFPMACLGTDG